ncbi:AAA family ATPase [Nonomuraea gerenzanensis]|nr:AAA family ATPase [Nonomuraea gerenzanensis]UBU12546.1 ATP-binding protein [Nonomuraea gerenzanensis]
MTASEASLPGLPSPADPSDDNAADQLIEHTLLEVTGHPAKAEADILLNGVIDAWRRHQGRGSSKPTLTLVAGYAGSGKTEFSRFLSYLTGWPLLDKDTLTRPLVERLLASLGGDPDDRHTELYLREVRPLEYRCMMETAFDNLSAGTSAILSAPFIAELADPNWVSHLINRCAAGGVDVAVVWVRCDAASMRKHIELRGDPRDAWKLQNWEAYADTLNTETHPSTAHVVVDNRLGTAIALVHQARKKLNRILAGLELP